MQDMSWKAKSRNTMGIFLDYGDEKMELAREENALLMRREDIHPALMLNFDEFWSKKTRYSARKFFKDRKKAGRLKRCFLGRAPDCIKQDPVEDGNEGISVIPSIWFNGDKGPICMKTKAQPNPFFLRCTPFEYHTTPLAPTSPPLSVAR